jgi:hypothetical protein
MAYCVRCGVKLEPGATECPLCNTKVIATDDLIGTSTDPLFPITAGAKDDEHMRLDKRRKGFIELVVAFMGISIVTLLITGFALNSTHNFDPWLPIACVFIGGWYLLSLLLFKLTYTRLATIYTLLTMTLLFFIDIYNFPLTWSLYPISALGVFWVVGVMPWLLKRRRLVLGTVAGILAVAVFLLVVDALEGDGLAWFFPVALPTLLVVVVSASVLLLRLRGGNLLVSEVVMSVILIAAIGVGSGDFFAQRFLGSDQILSWSVNVWVVAAILGVFLFVLATVKKVKLFFVNKIDK